ncbi:MAG: HYR domain-containing protein [Cyanobacteria bacterium]|nr:HYR domain-containing protein [Cyanobacteriota bacterium]
MWNATDELKTIRGTISVFLTLLVLVSGAACNKTPTAPTPPPPPPIAEPPELTCPAPVTVSARTSAGSLVSYPPPESRKGQGSVSVVCTPASDTTFPIGVTETQCVATDSLSRTASCTFSVTVAGPPRLRRTRIMAFGDSLTFGSTLLTSDPYLFSFPAETAYPTVLGQLLSARYTDQTITVFNRGLVGEQAWRALSRFGATFSADAPDVVVLLEGVNDYRVALDEGTTVGVDNAVLGMSQLAAEARRRGARVFICTLTPGRPGRIQIPASVLETINERYRQIARGEGAVLVDLYTALLPDLNGNVSIDGLHLTPLGYRRVAETVFAAIRADLEVR